MTTNEMTTGPAAADDAQPGRRPSHQLRWFVLAVLSLAQLMDVLDGTIINIALPDAQRNLGFDVTNREWLVTGYALAYGGLLLLGGRLSDKFGRRRLLLTGLVGFGICSAAGGLAVNFEMLLAARIAQGVFAALLAPAALSLVSVTFADDAAERGRAFSVFGAVSGMGGAVGLVLGGFLVDALSWRWCLYVNVFVAAAALAGAIAVVRDDGPRDARGSLDVPGAAAVTAGLFGLVYGLGNSAVHGWSTVTTWLPLAAGVTLIAGFVVRERRVATPLLPLSVVLDRNRGAAFLGVAVAGVGSFAIFLYLSYYLQQTLGYSALHSGLAFLPFAGVLIAGAGVSGRLLLPRTGPRVIVPLGGLLCAASLVLLTRIGQHSSYVTGVLPAVLLFGFGTGLLFGCAQNVATSGVDPEDSGVASAMVNTMQQVGGSIGLALFTSISAAAVQRYVSDHAGGAHSARVQASAALASYQTVFWVAAAVFVAGALLTAATFRPGPVDTSDPSDR